MKIILKKLRLLNFKGTRDSLFEFNDDITNISGDNGTGKSTIADAFMWLLFGKDSGDSSTFSIKTLDGNNKVIQKLDHEVEGLLDIDGSEVKLKRCLREKWVKARGAEIATFTGNETLYYFNDVPMQAKEYTEKVDSYVKENMFKLLTSTTFFSGLHWEKKRSALLEVAGEINEQEIIGDDKGFKNIFDVLQSQKITLDQLKTQVAAKKKKLKDELEQIQPRIEEVNRATPEEPPYNMVTAQIATYDKELIDIEGQINSKLKSSAAVNKKKLEKQNKVHELTTKIKEIEFAEQSKIQLESNHAEIEVNKIKSQIKAKENDLADNIKHRLKNNELKKASVNIKIAALREQFKIENEKVLVFDENKFSCPTCKRAYEANDIEEVKSTLTKNFNADKVAKLESINTTGIGLSNDIKTLTESIAKDTEIVGLCNSEILVLKNKIAAPAPDSDIEIPKVTTLADLLLINKEYQTLTKSLETLNNEPAPEQPNTTELTTRKTEVNTLLDIEKKKLALKDVIETNKKRIIELQESEKTLSQQIAGFEKTEFAINNYTKAKSAIIEQRVNQMFSFVQFKLFETQINNSEVPCCEILVNGVPFKDVNTGGQVCAGMDIIKTLGKYYNIQVTLFVDQKEVVSIIPKMECQVIALTKVEGQNTLKIE